MIWTRGRWNGACRSAGPRPSTIGRICVDREHGTALRKGIHSTVVAEGPYWGLRTCMDRTLTLGEGYEEANHRCTGRGERRILRGSSCCTGLPVPPDHHDRALCRRRPERCDRPTPRSVDVEHLQAA